MSLKAVTPFGFAGATGYKEDYDSGLMLLGDRYDDPSAGRFITRDPARDGRNWFIYCRANPVKFVDTRGLVPDKAYFDPVKSRHENNSVVVITGETDGGNGDISDWVETALGLDEVFPIGSDESDDFLYYDLRLGGERMFLWDRLKSPELSQDNSHFLAESIDHFVASLVVLTDEEIFQM